MFRWYIGDKLREQSVIFVDYHLHYFCTVLYYVCKKLMFFVTSAHDRKDGNFIKNPAKYWSFAACSLNKCWFQVKTVKILISHKRATTKTLNSLKLRPNVNYMQCWYPVINRQLKFWFNIITSPQHVNFIQGVSSKMSISGLSSLNCWFRVNAGQQGCWFHLEARKMFISHAARKLKNADFRSK